MEGQDRGVCGASREDARCRVRRKGHHAGCVRPRWIPLPRPRQGHRRRRSRRRRRDVSALRECDARARLDRRASRARLDRARRCCLDHIHLHFVIVNC